MSERPASPCTRCGEEHGEPPLAFHAPAPDVWTPELADHPGSELTADLCVINGEHFLVHGLLEIPVIDTGETFAWGVWVSLSRDNFARALDLWERPGRESEPPYFGWLTTALPFYEPSTLNLKTNLHTRPVGERPFVEVEPTDHPLAVEQRDGITRERVQQFAEALLHSES